MTDDEVLGRAYDGRLMRRLLTYLRPYRGQVALAIAAIIAHSALDLVPPYLTKIVIDRYIPVADLGGLGTIAALYLAALLASFLLEYLQTCTMQLIGQRIMFDLRMQLVSHLHRLDLKFYDRNPVGRLMTRLTTDVDVLNELFTSGVVSVFGDVFTLIGIMAVLVWMDWRLAIAAFSVLPLIVAVTQWFRVNARESYRTVRTWIARINAYLQERITGMATVQLYRREARDYAAFSMAMDRDAFLRPATKALAWTPVKSPSGENFPYALGWFATDYKGVRVIWHYGYWTASSTLVIKVPSLGLTFVVLANTDGLSSPYRLGAGKLDDSPWAREFLETFVIARLPLP